MTAKQRLFFVALVLVPVLLLLTVSDPHSVHRHEAGPHRPKLLVVSPPPAELNWLPAAQPLPPEGALAPPPRSTRSAQQFPQSSGAPQPPLAPPVSIAPPNASWTSHLLGSDQGLRPLSGEPVFYVREAAVEQRRSDAPEDAFGEDVAQYLPSEDQLPAHLGICAVVGNSRTLRGSLHGKAVDAADTVIRVNQAPAGGEYAKDVGSRTTLRLLNMKWTEVYSSPSPKDWGRASVINRAEASRLIAADPAGQTWLVSARTRGNVLKQLALRRDASSHYRAPFPLLLRKAFIGWVHHRLSRFAAGQSEQDNNVSNSDAQPSTGIMAVLLAMRLCSQVRVYGFSGQVCRGARHCSKAAHYWAASGQRRWIDADRLVTHPSHKFGLEARLLCKLSSSGQRGATAGAVDEPPVQVYWDHGSGKTPPCGSHGGPVLSINSQ